MRTCERVRWGRQHPGTHDLQLVGVVMSIRQHLKADYPVVLFKSGTRLHRVYFDVFCVCLRG